LAKQEMTASFLKEEKWISLVTDGGHSL